MDVTTNNIIAPSLLSADILHLEKEIKELEAHGADWFHVDIMDGHFVPNLTFGPHILAAIRDITHLPLDVHMMVEHPENFIEAFYKAGADLLTVQVESTPNIHRVLQRIRSFGIKAGITLNPGTPVDMIVPLLPFVDLVLIMTVNPGFGGQLFIEPMLEKIEKVAELKRVHNYSYVIEVDGGVVPETAKKCKEAGAEVFVAGSYVFKGNETKERIAALRAAVSDA